MPVPLWPDNPGPPDLLNFSHVVDLIADATRRERLDPVTLGIEGEWGSGKSTLLKLLARNLRLSKRPVVVVEVNPWEFDSGIDPQGAIIAEVLRAIQKVTAGTQQFELVKEKIRKIGGRLSSKKLLKVGIDAAAGSLPGPTDILELISDDDGGADRPTSGVKEFRERFAELLDGLSGVERVVVLVDDLDRCVPVKSLAVLEGIKLFLSVPKTVFVLATDSRAVAHAVSSLYDSSPHADELGKQYIEKIVQIPIQVPRMLTVGEAESFLILVSMQHVLRRSAALRSKLDDIVKCYWERHSSLEEILVQERVFERFTESRPMHNLAVFLAPHIYCRLRGNPRRMKRFLNAYYIRKAIVSDRKVEIDPQSLAMWMILEECHPVEFSLVLESWSEGNVVDMLKRLKKKADSGGGSGAVLASWLSEVSDVERLTAEEYLGVAASHVRSRQPGVQPPTSLAAIVKNADVAVSDDARRPDPGRSQPQPPASHRVPGVPGAGPPAGPPAAPPSLNQPQPPQRQSAAPLDRRLWDPPLGGPSRG